MLQELFKGGRELFKVGKYSREETIQNRKLYREISCLKSENTYLGADSSHDSHADLLDPTKVGEHNKDN